MHKAGSSDPPQTVSSAPARVSGEQLPPFGVSHPQLSVSREGPFPALSRGYREIFQPLLAVSGCWQLVSGLLWTDFSIAPSVVSL